MALWVAPPRQSLYLRASALCALPLLTTVRGSCFEYVGCFTDAISSRDLEHAMPSLHWELLTVGKCAEACGKSGFVFAGLQNGQASGNASCWCGNSYGRYGAADGIWNRCDSHCPQSQSDKCGGYNGHAGPNSVYKLDLRYKYIGCYIDAPWDRDLRYAVIELNWLDMTVDACAGACAKSGFKFAGIQDGNEAGHASCWCGNSYGLHGPADGNFDRCYQHCPADPSSLCGGYNGYAGPNSVYQTRKVLRICNGGQCSASEKCSCGAMFSSGEFCEIPSICRFAPSFKWDVARISDSDQEDVYLRYMLTWDGRFASPGYGIFSHELPLTCDHVVFDSMGKPLPQAAQCSTSPSKEALHISMLALVLSRTPNSWMWMYSGGPEQAPNEKIALQLARHRLTRIIQQYEILHTKHPGLGGCIPWINVDVQGFVIGRTFNVEISSVDNAQLVWALIAAKQALKKDASWMLAHRYQTHIDVMLRSWKQLFYNPASNEAATFSVVTVTNTQQEPSTVNRRGTGAVGDPYTGELAIMLLDLFHDWPSKEERSKLWGSVKKNKVVKQFWQAGVPNGPISVQRGWRFSAHEQLKYLFLPYLDNTLVRRLFVNGEKARTWYSHLNRIPGLMSATYNTQLQYVDVLGVQQLSMGYAEPHLSDLMICPAGVFPLLLASKPDGLAWHRAMLGRPQMQTLLGSIEAGQAFGTAVALKASWDSKVTVDIAALGGIGSLVKEGLRFSTPRWERWNELLEELHSPYFTNLQGESTPVAPPPPLQDTDNVMSPTPDFSNCRRSIAKSKPEFLRPTSAGVYTVINGSNTTKLASMPVDAHGHLMLHDARRRSSDYLRSLHRRQG